MLQVKDLTDASNLLLHAHLRLGWGPRADQKDSQLIANHFDGWTLKEAKRHLVEQICKSLYRDYKLYPGVDKKLQDLIGEIHQWGHKGLPAQRHKVKQESLRKKRAQIDLDYIKKIKHYNVSYLVVNASHEPGLAFTTFIHEFWFNHFNVDGSSQGINSYLPDYFQVIGQNMHKTFFELLSQVSRHPSMQLYLDNFTNHRPDFNLNYARELLELHSLGARPEDNVYSQKDLEELAKILSGYTQSADRSTRIFWDELHSPDKKVFLGKTYSKGEQSIDKVIRKLANHPKTKKFICHKLGLRMTGQQLKAHEIKQCQKAWGQDGRLLKVYKSILLTQTMWKRDHLGQLLKNPLMLVISGYRATLSKMVPQDITTLRTYLYKNGMPVGVYASPDGYDDDFSTWIIPLSYVTNWKSYSQQLFRESNESDQTTRAQFLNFDDLKFTQR